MYYFMRYLPAYKWEDVLDELVPRTLETLKLMKKEESGKAKAMEKKNGR